MQMRISSVGSEVGARIVAKVGVPFRPTPAGAWHPLMLRFMTRAGDISAAWRAMSLTRRYLVASLLALAVYAVVLGLWLGLGDAPQADPVSAHAQSWLVMAVLALVLLAVPFKIVRSFARQIEQQQRLIDEQKAEALRLASRNEALGNLAKVIQQRGLEYNERQLRRIGSDLHDGPAQHLALVLLRLDELAPGIDRPAESDPGASRNALEIIRRATSDALKEIRHISGGLALPELQKISLNDALGIAVRAHQRATGTRVETIIGNLPARLPLPMTICLYRFAQEALNNSFRHAGGKGQRLGASYDGQTISVEVADSGPGFMTERPANGGERLGLSGLRYRVESLGGLLQINSVIGQGARLAVHFRNPLA
jgi:signal transduction histidine kinase